MSEPAVASTTREPLSRERVLAAAVALADGSGLESLSMRRLGQELGVEAMSLYHHVAGKEALLDGMVDSALSEVHAETLDPRGPDPAVDWAAALRARILAARRVMLRHRWLPGLLESRTTLSPSIVAYFEAVLGTLHAGGFTYDLAHHALHALGSRALGFSQELFDLGDATDAEISPAEMAAMAEAFPHLGAMLAEVAHDGPESTLGWCDDQTEFEFGLDALLDGLERRRAAQDR